MRLFQKSGNNETHSYASLQEPIVGPATNNGGIVGQATNNGSDIFIPVIYDSYFLLLVNYLFVMTISTVKYIELRPAAFLERLRQHPLAYLPLGTLEWHGEHLPLGADAIQSEALMIACAQRFGGIVLPILFLGPDRRMETDSGNYLIGMDYAKSTSPNQQLTGSCYWVSYDFFKQLLENILEQLRRAGFKAVFADGHGPSRRTWVEMIPAWEKQFELKLFGITEDIKHNWNYMMDHAAKNETSIVMHLQPDLVDLSVFPDGKDSPLIGVNGEHPYLATSQEGKIYFEEAIRILESKLKHTSELI